MKQPQIQLEEIKIPKVSEDDIMETIQKSKMIMQQLPTVKKEQSLFHSIKQIIVFHGWRSLLTQGMLVLFLIMFARFTLPILDENKTIVFMMVTSVTLSVAISYELYRVELFQMKELEYSCVYSPQRMFVWKILILSMISLIGIIVVCMYIANSYEFHFMTLIYSGCIPLIILNGTALHLTQHQNTFTVFLILCMCFVLVSFVFSINYTQLLQDRGLLCLVLSVLYYIGMHIWICRRKSLL